MAEVNSNPPRLSTDTHAAHYLTFVVNEGLRLDGVALRVTRDGRTTLSFPAKRTRGGQTKPYLRPSDDETREVIERQVLGALAVAERQHEGGRS